MSPRPRPFMQVDVFNSSSIPLSGNPLAVVLDSEDISTETMQKFASWTNLSETTFLLPPTDPTRADYQLRIFTTKRELKFAGHPTLGSCYAWLEAGGKPKQEGEIIQECGIGLVTIRQDQSTGRLSFAAPGFIREGDVSPADLLTLCDAMGVHPRDVLASRWIDNGPGWVGILLKSAEDVMAIKRDGISKANSLKWGVVGPYEKAQARVAGGGKKERVSTEAVIQDDSPDFEVRAFSPDLPGLEDPVTGSLNAGIGKWLISNGLAPQHYIASQGTCMGRSGRVYVTADRELAEGGEVWVGGETNVCIKGEVFL